MNKAAPSQTLSATRTAPPQVGIVSLCCDDWGGSEELWARSVPHLLQQGMAVTLLKSRINAQHPRIAALAQSGVKLQPLGTGWEGMRLLKKIRDRVTGKGFGSWELLKFAQYLQACRPQLVVVAQGINFDGLEYAGLCGQYKVPYIVVCQKAVDFYWPPAHLRHYMRQVYQAAEKCFFVSQHNQLLTEEQFGFRFSNACVIHNPVRFTPKTLPFPDEKATVKLACVGRLFIIDKGQDILLRILAQEKWRSRPVEVSFVGSGTDAEGVREMAQLLQVDKVHFAGQVENMEAVWQTHHALVLPSRSEGAPLVVLEALAMGRPVIVSRAGGTPEYVQEGVNGFLAEATVEDFDAAMERAWQQRAHWPRMGAAAVDKIKDQISGCPEEVFANEITNLVYGN